MSKNSKRIENDMKEQTGAGAGGVGGAIEVGAQKLAPIGMKSKELSQPTNSYIEKNKKEGAQKVLPFKEWICLP